MTNEEAQLINSIDPLHWKVLIDVIEKEREIIQKMLDDPGSSRDLDQFNKGGRAFGLQVIGYREMAFKILNPKKEEE
jgi:hypothetical protein